MSVHATSWVLKHCDESVPGRRLVLLVLADKADDDGRNSYPSVETIARQARLSERGVRYALRALEADGRLELLGQHPVYGTNEYRVVMDRGGAACAPGNLKQEGGQSVTDDVSQIAPEPSFYPSVNQPPLPPASGGSQSDPAPERPASNRERGIDAWREAVDAWGARHFPNALVGAVRTCVADLGGTPSADEVRAYAVRRGEAWIGSLEPPLT